MKKDLSNEEIKKALESLIECKTAEEIQDILKKNPKWKDVPEIAKAIIYKDSNYLQYFSANIKNNYKIVEDAIKVSSGSIIYASKNLQQNKNLVYIALQKYPDFYEKISSKLKMDEDLVRVYWNSRHDIKGVPSDFFETHRKFTADMLKFEGYELEHLSKKIKNDFDLVELAIKSKGENIKFASKELQNNFYLANLAVSGSADNYFLLSKDLKNNKEIIKTALSKRGIFLQNFENTPYINDLELVTIAVKQSGASIKYASPVLRKNIDLNVLALESNSMAIFELDEDVISEPKILITLFKVALSNNLNVFLNFDETRSNIPKKERLYQLNELLKSKNKEFFVETYNQFMSDKTDDYKNILSSNKECFDLFLKHADKEILKGLIINNVDENDHKVIFMNKILNESILRKNMEDIHINNKSIKNRVLKY